MHVRMHVWDFIVCLHFAPFPKKNSNNKILSCLLTYVDYLMHLVHLEYLLRRCCYLTVKKLFDFFYFSHSYITLRLVSETGTRKKGEMKNQDWLWRQHRPHTRFVKARNVTHLSLLYTEFLTLFVWEFRVSRRHEQKCILFLLSTEFISSHFFKCIY